MNEEVEHVVALAADLQSSLDPVQLGRLEELCGFELAEKVLFIEGFRGTMFEGVEDIAFLSDEFKGIEMRKGLAFHKSISTKTRLFQINQ